MLTAHFNLCNCTNRSLSGRIEETEKCTAGREGVASWEGRGGSEGPKQFLGSYTSAWKFFLSEHTSTLFHPAECISDEKVRV